MCQSQSACAKCHQPILKRHRHLPEVDESISASPIPIGPAARTLFAKKAKNEYCANRRVPSANDRLLIRHHHLPEVETHRSVPLPIAIGPAVRTLFAKN